MVCVGQPVLVAGDLNADPAVIPCLAKGISAGRYVDLALAYSRELAFPLMLAVGLVGGHRFTSGVLCRMSQCAGCC